MDTENLNAFLLIGQSNMAGAGDLDAVAPIEHPYIWMFREGEWQPAEEPLHPDGGAGLGMTFALDLLDYEPGATIGLIPCAVGGTPIARWVPGGDLYENAVACAQAAVDPEHLMGVLWHQGESDADDPTNAQAYAGQLRTMVEGLRRDLGCPELSVIVGQLGTFLAETERFVYHDQVNRELKRVARELPLMAYVASRELEDTGDHVHFDAPSLRIFGARYARAYIKLAELHDIALHWSLD